MPIQRLVFEPRSLKAPYEYCGLLVVFSCAFSDVAIEAPYIIVATARIGLLRDCPVIYMRWIISLIRIVLDRLSKPSLALL